MLLSGAVCAALECPTIFVNACNFSTLRATIALLQCTYLFKRFGITNAYMYKNACRPTAQPRNLMGYRGNFGWLEQLGKKPAITGKPRKPCSEPSNPARQGVNPLYAVQLRARLAAAQLRAMAA